MFTPEADEEFHKAHMLNFLLQRNSCDPMRSLTTISFSVKSTEFGQDAHNVCELAY